MHRQREEPLQDKDKNADLIDTSAQLEKKWRKDLAAEVND